MWAWRGLLAAALAWSVLAFSGSALAVVAVWLASEVAFRSHLARARE